MGSIFNPGCTACPLHKYARNRCVAGVGPSNPKLILVGEAPGRNEDRDGVPFVGRSGVLLNRALASVGLTRDDVYITNLVKCYSPQKPDPQEIATCKRRYLDKELAQFPDVPIVAMGAFAARWVGGKATVSSVERTVWTYGGRKIIGSYHPAAAVRGTIAEGLIREALFIAKSVADGHDDARLSVVEQVAPGVCAADCETTGLYRHLGHKPFLITMATRAGTKVFRIPEDVDAANRILGRMTRIRFWNACFDVPMFRSVGIDIPWSKVDDVQVWHALQHDGDRPYRLKQCAFRHLGIQEDKTAAFALYEFWKANKPLRNDFRRTPEHLIVPYAKEDAIYTLALGELDNPAGDAAIARVSGVEHEIQPIITKLYDDGIGFDTEYAASFLDNLDQRVVVARNALDGLNPASHKQIAAAFEKLGIHSSKRSKNSGAPSFDSEALAAIDHPLAKQITRWRQLKKMVEFIEKWFEFQVDGVIHAAVNQTGTETGRFSGGNPYLMNAPKNPWIRRCLIPRAGNEFWSFDWSQLQLRLFAEFARDTKMIKQLIDGYPKMDPYKIIAKALGIARDVAKMVQLAILFGAQEEKLSKAAKVPEDEVRRILNWFAIEYPIMSQAPQHVEAMLEQQGYVENWLGRRRRIGKDGARQGVNFIAQGGEADLLKVLLLRVRDILAGYPDARLALIVHDQIVLDCPPAVGEELAPKIWQAMTQGWPFSVPLDASVSSGRSMGTLEKIPRVMFDPVGAARM